VVSWKKEKRKNMQVEYSDLEHKLTKVVKIFPSQIFPSDVKEEIIALEKTKDEILKVEEELWRLKSRFVWLKIEDRNTKCFQKFAKNRKNYNNIWDVLDSEGNIQHTQNRIKVASLNFYSSLYKAKVNEDTLTHLNVLKEVPRFFTYEEINQFGKEVSLKEVEKIVELMPKDKILGSDGWVDELFHHFFYIMGKDLLNAVEETRFPIR